MTLDTFGVQDVFATTSVLENAGGGCTRIYNCIEKNGVLIPVGFAVVFPTMMLLKAAQTAEDFSRKRALAELVGAAFH